ncbi:MAG: hypothetical protein LQ340_006142 [Diploschistes diacapsis]|nr:MAG: hypothetical protein LQ340_006142 [Diploschistes diacapsis]
MEGKSCAADLYLKIHLTAPNKPLVDCGIHYICTVKCPPRETLGLEQCCRSVPRVRDAIAEAWKKIPLPKKTEEVIMGMFAHAAREIDEEVRLPSASSSSNSASGESRCKPTGASHSSKCRDCRGIEDLISGTDLTRKDGYSRVSQRVTITILSRLTNIAESRIIEELGKLKSQQEVPYNASAAPDQYRARTATAPLSGFPRLSLGAEELPVEAQKSPTFSAPKVDPTGITHSDLIRRLNDPRSEIGARVRAITRSVVDEAMRSSGRSLPMSSVLTEQDEAALFSQTADRMNSGAITRDSLSPERRDAIVELPTPVIQPRPHDNAINAAGTSGQLDLALRLPFTEDDLPESAQKSQKEANYGTMFGNTKRQQRHYSIESGNQDDVDRMDIDYDNDTVELSDKPTGRIIAKFDRVEVTRRRRAPNPEGTFDQLVENEQLSSPQSNSAQSEESEHMWPDTDTDEDGQPIIPRMRNTSSSPAAKRSKLFSASTTPSLRSSTSGQRASDRFMDAFNRWSLEQSSTSPTTATYVTPSSANPSPKIRSSAIGTHKRSTTKNISFNKDKPKPDKALRSASSNKRAASASSKSPQTASLPSERPVAPQTPHNQRAPVAPRTMTTSGRESREVNAEDVDIAKVSRDADKIITHKYTKKNFIKYKLQWKPDHPGWKPAVSWVPASKFREDRHFIEDYKRQGGFTQQDKQLKASAKADRTFNKTKELKNPRNRL